MQPPSAGVPDGGLAGRAPEAPGGPRSGAARLARRRCGMRNAMIVMAALLLGSAACTQETQNEIGRSIQNWTGTNGVLDVYAGDKLVKRFIKIDKLSTAYGTQDKAPRPYRYGYGVLDENQNYQVDPGERKLYFEISDYSTSYVFYESPR